MGKDTFDGNLLTSARESTSHVSLFILMAHAYCLDCVKGPAGAFDFSIEFSRTQSADPQDLPFELALKDQLGIKLQPQKAAQKVMVLDHVERPTKN